MKVLLDTNVLLRMAVVSHPTHAEAFAAVYRIRQRGDQPAIAPGTIRVLSGRNSPHFAEWTGSQHI